MMRLNRWMAWIDRLCAAVLLLPFLVLALLPAHAIVLHPGPMNRGMEISADVADSPRAVMVEQVANGVSVRMAVLYLLLGGMKEEI